MQKKQEVTRLIPSEERFESKYKLVAHKNRAAYMLWLEKMTYKMITLQSKGQDMEQVAVAENGEIIYTDFNASIYIGRFIRLDKLEIGHPLQIYDEKEKAWRIYMGLIPEKIENDYNLVEA